MTWRTQPNGKVFQRSGLCQNVMKQTLLLIVLDWGEIYLKLMQFILSYRYLNYYIRLPIYNFSKMLMYIHFAFIHVVDRCKHVLAL